MGIIMFIMLVGVHPFDLEGGTSDTDILRRVAQAEASKMYKTVCVCTLPNSP